MCRVRNPWLGLDSSADPVGLARLLMRAHERTLAGGGSEEILRDVVTRSWERSRLAGVNAVDRHDAPLLHERRDVAERWRTHPLARFAPLVRENLSDFAYDARHIVVIGDADGCLLWSAGHPIVLAASEDIGFVPGRLWREEATGTNGVGTAIAVDHPVQIFSAEHFSRSIHGWTCSGAPVHDPETGKVLGIIDLSSGIRAAHPHSLALVTATARMVRRGSAPISCSAVSGCGPGSSSASHVARRRRARSSIAPATSSPVTRPARSRGGWSRRRAAAGARSAASGWRASPSATARSSCRRGSRPGARARCACGRWARHGGGHRLGPADRAAAAAQRDRGAARAAPGGHDGGARSPASSTGTRASG